nr:hypothetical protein CFP56_28059 [Quercus suber]
MEKIKFILGFFNSLIVPSQGKSGGLALFWSKDVKLEIKSYSQNHIDAIISEQDSNFTWRFTGFYGHPESHLRNDSWKLLSYLNNQLSLPWFCCDDFNEILSFSEKSGGPQRPQRQMDGFRDRIYLHLDRAFANSDWIHKFSNRKVHHVTDSTSDHYILRITDSRAPPPLRKCRFHFEVLWAKRDDCHGIVEAAWNSGCISNSPEGIATNLSLCASELSN